MTWVNTIDTSVKRSYNLRQNVDKRNLVKSFSCTYLRMRMSGQRFENMTS
jgi:hypothetical protein